jgi:hypothetical protein
MDHGSDESILGRWSWMRLRGSNGRTLRFVNVYRPVVSNGATSAYQQQKSVFLDQGLDDCPRKKLLTDLQHNLKKWIEEGDQVIVAGDFNDDVRTGLVHTTFMELNMDELILRQHGSNAPNTFIKGSVPIDGIFGTKGLDVLFSGYTSGNWGLLSDHRALWVDLDMYSTFGGISAPLWRPRIRRLKLEDPRIVNTFNKLRRQHLEKHNLESIRSHIAQLRDQDRNDDNTWIQAFERLDRLRVQGILEADRRCRRIKCGNVPWSPAIQQCMNRIGYLQACRRKLVFHKQVNSRTLQKLFKKTNFTAPVLTGDDVTLKLRIQYNELNLLKSRASQIRGNFLVELADTKAAAGNQEADTVLRQLMLREEQRSIAHSVKRVLHKNRRGVTAIEAVNQQGEWVIFTDKETIERSCVQENIARFTQASHLPIMSAESIQSIGWFAETPVSRHILQGTPNEMDFTHLDQSIQRLIPFLKRPPMVQDIDCSLSTEQYIYEWSRGREFTSAGPSQVHFGHFKASCQDETLVELDRWMAELSFCSGYALQRWTKGIDVMIPKKNDSLRADQLRTIVLMEADFNFLNKIAGKRIMANAEKSNSIADEQFGSRKMKGAINHAVNKQLTLDIMRQEKRKFTLVILDAKGCYDRIAPPIASLSLKRQGTPASYVIMLFSTIQAMQHFIRTAYGDSREFYRQEDVPFHGILQGNGAGPTIWAMVSSPLLDRMREKGHGIPIHSSEGLITIPAFAFVDDTDLVQDNENDEAIESTQRAVSEWEDSLRATGGLLVPHKCKFYVVEHKWASDKWKIVDALHESVELKILDDEGRQHSIQQVAAGASELALGIMFSPSGNMEGETKYLREKAITWADKVRSGHLSHKEAWYCLNTTVLRAIEYALPATTMSYKQLNWVIQPILNSGLPRSGICRKTSRTLVFAPITYQGFGIRHPFIGQGVYKIRMLFDIRQSLCQKLIDVSWSRVMVESGLGPQFLNTDITWFKEFLTGGWMISLLEFVSHFNINITRMDYSNNIQFRHSKDCYLMEAVAQEGQDLTKADRAIFNSCRLYLQVTLLSDISTADGRAIQRHFWKGIRQIPGEGWWPKQPRPSERSWNVWRRILKRVFSTNDSGWYINKFSKTNPTGDWRWFLQSSTEHLFEKTNEGWKEYHPLAGRHNTRTKLYGNPQISSEPQKHSLTAVSTYLKQEGVVIDGIGTTTDITQIKPSTWYDCRDHKEVGDLEKLQTAVTQQQQLIIVSDGSAKDDIAAAAWIMTTERSFLEGIYIVERAKIPGNNPDSHRAECCGILGGLSLLLSMLNQWNLLSHEVNVCFACDNKSALGYSFEVQKGIGADSPDFDILQEIRKLLQELRVNTTWRHVKGHQVGPDLDIWAQLNNLADDFAGQARTDPGLSRPSSNVIIGKEKWHILDGGEKITKNTSKFLFDHCTVPQVRDILHRYKRVNAEGFHLVDWKSLERAMKESTIQQRHWISKRAARDCGCNYIRFKRKERKDDGCPFCGARETVVHVLTCPSAEPTQVWEKSLTELKCWMEQQGTDPSITHSLLLGLQTWRQDPESPTFYSNDQLIHQQSIIGWNSVLEGCLGSHWQIQQGMFFKGQNSRRSSHRWMSQLIRRIWKIPWDLWLNRNQKEHQQDLEKMRAQLHQEVQEQISQGHGDIHDLLQFFHPHELEKVNTMRDPIYVRAWLRNVKAGRRRDTLRRGTNEELRRMRAVMRAFLI